MIEDENVALKNKIDELKLRLQQIYAESFMDLNKSKAFEYEFSLYLKACEHAQEERAQSIKLQNDNARIGLTVLMVFSALTLYFFNMHVLFGMVILLGGGFFSCGFMYLLLVQEIRFMRAKKYCADLETYFKRYRWSIEQHEKLNLPTMPLWEEYTSRRDSALAGEGHYQKTALYAPFRIAITLMDLLALGSVIHSFIVRRPEISWIVLMVSCTVWVAAVVLQMLLVHSIITRVDSRAVGVEKDSPEESGKKGMSWRPGTWVTILRLFLTLDIVSHVRSSG